MKNIFKKIAGDNDHQCMTYAAVKALSSEDQKFLEPEKELLITTYCEFPDMTANCYGEWGGSSGYPEDPRSPDLRREWDLSYYLGWDTLLKKKIWAGGKKGGGMYLHSLPEAYPAASLYFKKAVEAFRSGEHADAVRFLGVLAHYVEDPVTFSNMQVIHRRCGAHTHIDHRQINIDDYSPRLLTKSIQDGPAKVVLRLRKAVRFAENMSIDARRYIRDNDWKGFYEMVKESNQEGSRAFADIIHTAICLGKNKQKKKQKQTDKNLVFNGDFQIEEDFFAPAGWFIKWHDLHDNIGVAPYEGNILRCNEISHSDNRSLKLMWTPKKGIEWLQRWRSSIAVEPGEKYKCSAWIRTHLATGNNVLRVHFYNRGNELIKTYSSSSIDKDSDWTLLSIDVCAPPEAEKMLIGLYSGGNTGAVWFDDVSVTRMNLNSKHKKELTEHKQQEEECCVLNLLFDRKPNCNISSIVDASVYGTEHTGSNFPIISCSGGEFADLHFHDKKRDMVLKFDGKDDFVEIAYSRINDVLNPIYEFTVAFWMFAEKKQEAYLVAKEYRKGDAYDGYRLSLGEKGLTWVVSHNHILSQLAYESYPTKKWIHVAGTVDKKGIQKLFLNGSLVMETSSRGMLSRALSNDFYLGADTGVDKFFCGMLDEVKIFKKALSLSEIENLI